MQEINKHLEDLRTNFEGYFSDIDNFAMDSAWIMNPFSFDISTMSDNDLTKDELIEFQQDPRKKADFQTVGLDVRQFWCTQMAAYPHLAKRALNVLIPFTTTYLCESGFSTLLHIKSKCRNRLDVSDDMRVALSVTLPRFSDLIARKQQQRAH